MSSAQESPTRKRVRDIVLEELARASPATVVRSSPDALYRRTQDMIRNASRNVILEPSVTQPVLPQQPTNTVVGPYPTAADVWGPRKRSHQTGHRPRLKATKIPKMTTLPKLKPDKSVYVWLLDTPISDDLDEYLFDDNLVLLKGYVSLNPDDSCEQIKESITDLFRTKYKLLSADDFEYVKRDRSKLSCPLTHPGFKWDFQSLKSLWGQGKLYCRIKVDCKNLVGEKVEDDKDTSSDEPSTLVSFQNEPQPGPSSVQDDFQKERIISLEGLVNELLDKKDDNSKKFTSVAQILEFLNSKISNEKEKLRVEQGCVFEDALGYYKESEFNPVLKMVVCYKGQAAIDTGGVARQFFTDVFTEMIEGSNSAIPTLFEGSDRRKLPIHNAGTVMSGIMEYVGKIMAHSLAQVGVGMCCLAPAVYRYLCCGDVSQVFHCFSSEDCVNKEINHYIEKVSIYIYYKFF